MRAAAAVGLGSAPCPLALPTLVWSIERELHPVVAARMREAIGRLEALWLIPPPRRDEASLDDPIRVQRIWGAWQAKLRALRARGRAADFDVSPFLPG